MHGHGEGAYGILRGDSDGFICWTDIAIACRRMINCDQTNRARQGTVTAAEERPIEIAADESEREMGSCDRMAVDGSSHFVHYVPHVRPPAIWLIL